MTVPWSDPRIARVPIRECDEPLVDVQASAPLLVAESPTYLRYGVVERLVTAQSFLPRAVRLLITDGCHPVIAPHTTGGAVDLTLSDEHLAREAAPTCRTTVTPPPYRTWNLLAAALTAAGLVNYPAHWWHWSYGDRFWAFVAQAPHGRYGPVSGR